MASLKLDLGYRTEESNLAGLLSDLRTSNRVPHSLRARMKERLREEYVSSSVSLEYRGLGGSNSSLSAVSALRTVFTAVFTAAGL